MASAQELLQEACDSGIACLEPGQLLQVYAQGLASTLGMNAQELISASCTSGIDCLEGDQLLKAIAEASRQIAANGGGSGCCNSDGVIDPVAAPADPTVTNMYTNTAPTPKTVWVWPAGGAAWIQVV